MKEFNTAYLIQNCALLGYYTANSGNFLPTFLDNLLVPSSGIKNKKKKGKMDS